MNRSPERGLIFELLHELAAALAVLVPCGAACGLVEAALLVAQGRVAIGGFRLLPAAALLYGVLGAITAAGLVVVRRVVLGRQAPSRATGWYLAAAVGLGVIVAVAYPLNRRWLPDAFGAMSLGINGALLVGGVPLIARVVARPCSRVASLAATSRGRCVIGGLLALLFAAAVAPLLLPMDRGARRGAVGDAGDRPNVLLLVIDTLRADHLRCYGGARPTSPRIDAVASRGVLFEHCIAQAPHTKPATASLLTGRIPPRLGVELFGASLPDREQPLAELLRGAGYRTGLFSANAFVAPTFGFGQGVDRYVGPMVSPAAPLAAFHVLARLRDVWVEALHWPERPWRLFEELVSLPFDRSGERSDPRAAELNEELLAFVDGTGAAVSFAPWFAQIQYMEAHAPYRPAEAHRLFEGAVALADVPPASRHLFLPFHGGTRLDAAARAALIATYDACIHEVDAAIGALLAALEQRGVLDHTVVVVTADHGEEFFDHGGWGHGHSLFTELVHVPLILSAPSLLPAGRRVSTQVRSIDLVPTLLELLALELPATAPPLDGETLLPLLRVDPDRPTPAAADRDGTTPAAPTAARPAFSSVQWGGSSALAQRDGARTVIVARDGADERLLAFDALLDPGETTDLVAMDPAHATVARRTAEALADYARAAAAAASVSAHAALDDATRSALQRLGYAGD